MRSREPLTILDELVLSLERALAVVICGCLILGLGTLSVALLHFFFSRVTG